jgi:septal ring factor EnvC (AmiA/AmiB activator)
LPIEPNGTKHVSKLLFWLLGLVGGLWLVLAGAFTQHMLNERASDSARLTALESDHAAMKQSREDQNRRLESIERKLDEIQQNIRKLY